MRASGTFEVTAFEPTSVTSSVATGLPVGVATMEKTFTGEVEGHAATVFTSAFDQDRGEGTYVAMESFEGALNGRAVAGNFSRSGTPHGTDRAPGFFTIVPASGSGELAGIRGTGAMTVETD